MRLAAARLDLRRAAAGATCAASRASSTPPGGDALAHRVAERREGDPRQVCRDELASVHLAADLAQHPDPPSQTRWIRRYSAGRLSRIPTA